MFHFLTERNRKKVILQKVILEKVILEKVIFTHEWDTKYGFILVTEAHLALVQVPV